MASLSRARRIALPLAVRAFDGLAMVFWHLTGGARLQHGPQKPEDDEYLRRLGLPHPEADHLCRELIASFAAQAGRWHTSDRKGPTGIGATAEKTAGITENNSRQPDYKGVVELKTGRLSGGKGSYITLFTLSPDYRASAYPSAKKLFDDFCYIGEGNLLRLNLALDTLKPNSRGHWIEVDTASGRLHGKHKKRGHTVMWDLNVLLQGAAKKLRHVVFVFAANQTGAVGADGKKKKEKFRYEYAVHARMRGGHTFLQLLAEGVISMEFNMREGKPDESSDHKNRGFSFRIRRRDLPQLFEIVAVYDLANGDAVDAQTAGIF